MDGAKAGTSGGNTLSGSRTAPLKPKPGLNGAPGASANVSPKQSLDGAPDLNFQLQSTSLAGRWERLPDAAASRSPFQCSRPADSSLNCLPGLRRSPSFRLLCRTGRRVQSAPA